MLQRFRGELQMLDSRGGGASGEIADRSGRGAEFGSAGPMERSGSGAPAWLASSGGDGRRNPVLAVPPVATPDRPSITPPTQGRRRVGGLGYLRGGNVAHREGHVADDRPDGERLAAGEVDLDQAVGGDEQSAVSQCQILIDVKAGEVADRNAERADGDECSVVRRDFRE